MGIRRGCYRKHLFFSGRFTPEAAREILQGERLSCEICGIGAAELEEATGLLASLYVIPARSCWPGGRLNFDLGVLCSICLDGFKQLGVCTSLPGDSEAGDERDGEQQAILDWFRLRKSHARSVQHSCT